MGSIPEREPERRLPLPRWAAGAQIAQCKDIFVRQRRTATILLVTSTSRTCNGCYPKTVMSINWRASLVPAAAVIPAPRAYANIAAVKTLVVCHRGQVCWVAGALPSGGALDTTPSSMSWSRSHDGAICSCSKSPSVGAKAVSTPNTCGDTKGTWPRATQQPLSTTGVHRCCHRGKLSVLKAFRLTGCPSMECQSIDQVWPWSCAGLGAHSGECGAALRGQGPSGFLPSELQY